MVSMGTSQRCRLVGIPPPHRALASAWVPRTRDGDDIACAGLSTEVEEVAPPN